MQATRARIEERHRSFKKGVDLDEARRKRDEHKVEIRKTKREETLMKKRREHPAAQTGREAPVSAFGTMDANATSSIAGAGGVGQGVSVPASTAGRAFPTPDGTAAAASTAAETMLESTSDASDSGAALLTTRSRQEILASMPALRDTLYQSGATPELLLRAVREFRRILSIERAPPIQEVIECQGTVEKFVEYLSYDQYPELQFEAAWALTNIASGNTEQTTVVVQAGALPLFVRLLQAPNEDVCEQAAWALGNIAGDSVQYRDLVLAHGAMEPLLQLLQTQRKPSMLRNATWTLSNFCRGKPAPEMSLILAALPVLAQLVQSSDEEVLVDTCWALSYLSDDKTENNSQIDAIIRSGIVPRVIELLGHESTAIQQPALRTIGNIVTGTDEQTQTVLDCGALPYLLRLLSSAKRLIRKETCWTVSNITAGTIEQIELVIENGLVPPLVSLLATSDFETRREAAWAISNATAGGTDPQIRALVMQGCIKPMCDLLLVNDSKLLIVVLEGLENILASGERERERMHQPANEYASLIEQVGGLEKIEMLQNHVNEDIYFKSQHILRTYFDVEEEDEIQGLVPMTASEGDGFGFGVDDVPCAIGWFSFRNKARSDAVVVLSDWVLDDDDDKACCRCSDQRA
ncbi:Importin alpha subunit (Karyopherin alpha subunit) (Serine-rich RNA polymerase I suppressor protein) [Cyanidiococcus yangmingshanensis]|uniref:Importin alpha subunit (Karyopherin alpha subunit) (Serine-rich RNA polymerase I suppressor protein) n=1 Tax=Cyanidiococcus yangmingshanensis TaxID=2690220 RepID=A0A7J7IG69_9RHOD|nr:Importin alpha subunit (Karyopherin alpha subunit) (Serine-rich RNA polymerase I suppressor protein) [Cyanidiococcus yangmingshanensis]